MSADARRILAVDDDASALDAVRQILTDQGYEVVTAADGEAALALLARERFDLVLLDVALPGMTGYDVCRRIRQDERTSELPVVFLTARGKVIEERHGMQSGSDLYLVKPVLASKLVSMVALFLSPDGPLGRRRPR